MTVEEKTSPAHGLRFSPSIEEQMLLPNVKDKNCLIVYPIESDLIRILTLFISFFKKSYNKKKILIISKLRNQNNVKDKLKSFLEYKMTCLNGSILPNARRQDYIRFPVILSTPKMTRNDIKEKFLPYDSFSLVLILNAEMAVSSSSLRYIIRKMKSSRIVALTQMTNKEKIEQICNNLNLKEVHSIQRTISRGNASNTQHYSLPLPEEYFFILKMLNSLKKYIITQLQQKGFKISIESDFKEINALHQSLEEENNTKLMITTGNLQRVLILQRIVISQGFKGVISYFNELKEKLSDSADFKGKMALEVFLEDQKIKKLLEYIELNAELEHPKIKMLLKLIDKEREGGISIVTHNYYNAEYLCKLLKDEGRSVLRIKEPITSIREVELKKQLLAWTERKVEVCITNSLNGYIAQNADIIIIYDVSANIIEIDYQLRSDTPRIFLLAKETNEEARYYYLKRLGNRTSYDLDFSSLNKKLKSTKVVETKHKEEKSKKVDLAFSPVLFEIGLPELFPLNEFTITKSNKREIAGITICDKSHLIIILPETLNNVFEHYKNTFNQLKSSFNDVLILFVPSTLEHLSLNARFEFYDTVWINGLVLFPIFKKTEIIDYVKKIYTQHCPRD
ncbi:MAG: hypothetical protein ACTSW1_15795 [Candidatus Hodarchaeales archaeon]